ncbi:MAG: hypothetical protein ACPL68_06245, partial [Candidatus Hydrothermia bacterium]
VFIKKKVLDSISSALCRPIAHNTYILNPLGYLRITGLDARPALSIDEVEVWFDPWTLIKERKIRTLNARGVSLNVDSLVAGIAAKTEPKPEPSQVKPVTYPVFTIERGKIRDATVMVGGATYTAKQIRASAISGPDTMRFSGSVLEGTSPYTNPDSVSLTVKIHRDGVDIVDINGGEKGRYTLEGGRVMVLPSKEAVNIWLTRAESPLGVSVDSARINILYEKRYMDVYATRVVYDTLQAEELRARIDMTRDSVITVTKGVFYFRENPVNFTGSLRTDSNLAWTAHVSAPQGIYLPVPGIFFAGDVSGEGQGTRSASLSLAIDTIAYRQYSFGHLSGTVDIRDWKRFSSSGLLVSGSSITGTISGWADLHRNLDLSFSLEALRLELFSKNMHGLAWGSGSLKRDRKTLLFSGEMEFQDCSWKEITLDRASLSVLARPDTLEGWVVAKGLSKGDLIVDSMRLEGAIRGGRGAYTLFARTRDAWLSSEGTVDVSGDTGALEASRLEMNIRGLSAMKGNGLVVKWRKDEISFSLPSGEVFFGLVSMGGRIRGDSILVALVVDSADLRALSSSFALKDTIEGVVSLYTTLGGTLQKPHIGNITIIARDLR